MKAIYCKQNSIENKTWHQVFQLERSRKLWERRQNVASHSVFCRSQKRHSGKLFISEILSKYRKLLMRLIEPRIVSISIRKNGPPVHVALSNWLPSQVSHLPTLDIHPNMVNDVSWKRLKVSETSRMFTLLLTIQ